MLDLRIRDLEGINDIIVRLSIDDKSNLITSILLAMQREKLELVRELSRKYKTEFNMDKFLVKGSVGEKIQTWGTFAATIIPVALSILAAILSSIFPKFVLQK